MADIVILLNCARHPIFYTTALLTRLVEFVEVFMTTTPGAQASLSVHDTHSNHQRLHQGIGSSTKIEQLTLQQNSSGLKLHCSKRPWMSSK